MKECCANCLFNKCEHTSGESAFYCDNEESDAYGTYTLYDDVCDEFAEKD